MFQEVLLSLITKPRDFFFLYIFSPSLLNTLQVRCITLPEIFPARRWPRQYLLKITMIACTPFSFQFLLFYHFFFFFSGYEWLGLWIHLTRKKIKCLRSLFFYQLQARLWTLICSLHPKWLKKKKKIVVQACLTLLFTKRPNTTRLLILVKTLVKFPLTTSQISLVLLPRYPSYSDRCLIF